MVKSLVIAALLFPLPLGPVNDFAHMLGDTQALEHKLIDYRTRTGNSIVVTSVANLGNMDIREYANKMFHEWGVGNSDKDNGVLILWAVKERKVRIEVGYGLESLLTDGRSGQILREIILPEFKAGRYDTGINNGVSAIITALDYMPAVQDTPQPETPSTGGNPGLYWQIPLGIFVIGLAWLIIHVRHKRRLEEEEDARRAAILENLRRSSTVQPVPSRLRPYVAPKRPYSPPAPIVHTEEPPVRRSTYSEPSYTPPSFDSSSSSSSWSSSDSGSSFGGGDSGGGGADGGY